LPHRTPSLPTTFAASPGVGGGNEAFKFFGPDTGEKKNVMSIFSLYQRMGGYEAITAVVDELSPRMMVDKKLRRFYFLQSADDVSGEKAALWAPSITLAAMGQ